jgi:hypothetical protein
MEAWLAQSQQQLRGYWIGYLGAEASVAGGRNIYLVQRDQPKRRNREVANTHPTNSTIASVSNPIMAPAPLGFRGKSYRWIIVDTRVIGLDNR